MDTAPEPGDRRATADYIRVMTSEMRDLARTNGLDFLAYLLGMAETEAEQHAAVERPTRIASKR